MKSFVFTYILLSVAHGEEDKGHIASDDNYKR